MGDGMYLIVSKIKQIFLLSFFLLSNIFSQANDLEGLPDHPRLLLSQEQCDILKTKIENDPLIGGLNSVLLNWADEIIELEPLEYEKVGKRLLGVSREYLRRLFYLSYAYRITGDKKYSDKAEREMLTSASFPDWNPSHFLDVGEMTMALSIGYDWLFDVLSVDSKSKIKNAIVNHGFLPSKIEKYTWWLNSKQNWNQVCNAGIAFGAWAIYEDEHELSREMIDRAKNTITLSQMDYEPDGVYIEGPMYWNYGTTFNTLFLAALENISISNKDFEINEGFLKSGEYFLNIFGTTGSFNYFDNKSRFFLSPAIFWYAMKHQDPILIYHQLEMLKDPNLFTNKKSSGRIFPMMIIWLSQLDLSNASVPENLSWTGRSSNPVSFHRTSWKKDAIFIGVKGGTPNLGHGHMDAGTFVMDADSVRWVMDLEQYDYNSLEAQGVDLWNMEQNSQRWTLIRYNNFGHSTLVINDQHQRVDAICPIINNYTEDKKQGATIKQ